MGSKPEALQISFVRRNAPSGGPTSSAAYNDLQEELARDLSTLSSQWSQSIVPLTDALPDGTVDVSVDAFINGLDAKNVYTNHDATASVDSSYYSVTAGRPKTIYEDLVSLSSGISDLREELEDRIDNLITTAAQVAVSDVGSLYTAENVEVALQEVMSKLNLLVLGNLDLSSVGQHYVPAIDNAWDIGTSSKRIRASYVYTLNAAGTITATGNLRTDGLLQFSGTTSSYPALKRDGTTVFVRLADDSDYAGLACKNLNIYGPFGEHTYTSFYLVGSDQTWRLRNSVHLQWANSASYSGTKDVGIARGSAGVIKITDGGAGFGDLLVSGIQSTGQIWSDLVSGLQPAGTTQEVNFSYGNTQMLDLEDATGDVTLTLSNMQPGGSYALIISQDSAVARDLVWPGNVQWPDGVTPTLSAGANARDMFTLVYDGLFVMGNVGQNYS